MQTYHPTLTTMQTKTRMVLGESLASVPAMTEVDNNYIGTSVIVPHGDGISQGRVCKRTCDNKRNPIGRVCGS